MTREAKLCYIEEHIANKKVRRTDSDFGLVEEGIYLCEWNIRGRTFRLDTWETFRSRSLFGKHLDFVSIMKNKTGYVFQARHGNITYEVVDQV